MRKNRLLSLLLMAAMTVASAVTLSSCSDNDSSSDLALKYNVAGTWYAQFDADGTVGGSQMQYNRLITACTFNDDGTGTWYKFMLTDESGEPIALDGGTGHGDFTYSVGTDGKITCRLTWSQAPSYYPSTLTFAASGDIIKGQEGTVAYDMKKASENMKAWITDWDSELNNGSNAPRRSGATIAATTADVGKVIGTDGKIYRNAAAATSAGTVATAMIAYVGSQTGNATYNHGLAIALTEEADKMNYSSAVSTCSRKDKYAGALWCVPNDDQWKQMFKANGGDEESIAGLNAAITAAGGTAESDGYYWSSTVINDNYVSLMVFDECVVFFKHANTGAWLPFRACLVF